MLLTLSKECIGSDSNLVYDGNTWKWSDDVSPESILWGFDNPRDIRSAARSLRLEISDFTSTPWGNVQSVIRPNPTNTPWSHCVPTAMWKKHVSAMAEQLWIHFNNSNNLYYTTTHLRNREIIGSLKQSAINLSMLDKKIACESKNNQHALSKFRPEKGDLCPRSKYSLSGTVTGRMTVSHGPNILTMKKEDRAIFKSRMKRGRIAEIDLGSAEPRVALAMFGKSIDGDIYKKIAQTVNLTIDRDIAKIATLSAIYGASHHTLKSKLSSDSDARKVLDLVREYFGVRHLEAMLHEQHDSLGYITNTHGRKIFSETPSVNHLIQSSTVDVAFDVFELLLARSQELKIRINPIYLIHDAIIVDVHEDDYSKLVSICDKGFWSEILKINFPVSVKEIK